MAPHSSTLAWEIPWTEEPGGLPSMGHDWRDLAAAAGHSLSNQNWTLLVKLETTTGNIWEFKELIIWQIFMSWLFPSLEEATGMCGFNLQDDLGVWTRRQRGAWPWVRYNGVCSPALTLTDTWLWQQAHLWASGLQPKWKKHHLPAGLLSELNKMMSVAHQVQY